MVGPAPLLRRRLLLGLAGSLAAFLAGCGQPPAAASGERSAWVAWQAIVSDFEQSSWHALDQALPPAIVGRAQIIEDASRALLVQRQMQIRFQDIQVTPGPEATELRAAWDKRWVNANGQPQQARGQLQVIMRPAGRRWEIQSLGPDHPLK